MKTEDNATKTKYGATKERPIIFSGEMVRAILGGTKTQTRRVIKPQPHQRDSGYTWFGRNCFASNSDLLAELMEDYCPHGQVGDRLWVRETWAHVDGEVWYAADGIDKPRADGVRVHPSIFMPRWASRIALEITGVRVERVREISDADVRAEGVAWDCGYLNKCNSSRCPTLQRDPFHDGTLHDFERLWDSINAKRGFGWNINPFVWVVEFKRVIP